MGPGHLAIRSTCLALALVASCSRWTRVAPMALERGQRARLILVDDRRVDLRVLEARPADPALGRSEAVIAGVDAYEGRRAQVPLGLIRDAEVLDRSAAVSTGGYIALGVLGGILTMGLVTALGLAALSSLH